VAVQGTVALAGRVKPLKTKLAFEDGVAEPKLSVADARFWSNKDPYLYDPSIQAESDHYT
jgi:beta-galactosidase/beta-glucuronidase